MYFFFFTFFQCDNVKLFRWKNNIELNKHRNKPATRIDIKKIQADVKKNLMRIFF